ncbi:MAG: CotH kinase family protein [Verrucomicrobiaceae bacterium]
MILLRTTIGLLLSLSSVHAELAITEFSANPDESLPDTDGDFPDWIEIQNTGASPLSTAGYTLTDQPASPNLWILPDLTLQPNDFLLIFASGKDRTNPAEPLHTNFSLASDGGHLALHAPDLTPLSSFTYPQQAYGFSSNSSGFFATPTPGLANGPVDFTDYVRDTKFNPDRGFYDAPFPLTITSATPGATIYFTTDGSAPSPTNGTLYSGPIEITTTTVVRALATKPGLLSSNVDAHSYFFLQDVITQPSSITGFPDTWGIDDSTSNGATNLPRPADYEMDPRVIAQFGAPEAIAALQNHPTISVVMDPDHLWNESTDSATGGIYPNPYGGTGNQFRTGWGEPRDWERPCSVEFIGFPKVPGKQVNAGIRMAGNFARHPNRYKHHFRLTSRREYGPSKFKGELFSRTEVDTFDDFILRGGNSEAWTFPGSSGNGPGTRANVQYVRDQFYKDAQIDMGNLSASQEYFHLYLNGAYWGFYTLIERVDAHFLSQHLGGEEEDFDVIKQANVLSDGSKDDWEAMYAISRAGVSTEENYNAIQEYLDLDNFIDYMIFNFWAATVDWRNNWRAGRRSRNADGFGFQFYNWDGERGLGDQSGNRTYTFNSAQSSRSWTYHPNEMHHDLKLNPEYQIRFADRVQKHLFNNGTLSPERAALLYNARAEEVRPALIVESARWGDRQRPSNPYTTENEWQDMLDYLNNTFFPLRNPVVIHQLRVEGVFPNIDAPSFNQHGGTIPDGFPLLISNNGGTTYFTVDGSDPRLPGGDINPAAMIATGGTLTSTPITRGDDWHFNADDLDIGNTWKDFSFDATSWSSGPTPIGYGGVTNTVHATDLRELTDTPLGTIYYRKTFTIESAIDILGATIEANIDGGAVFYLNGVEVLRDNMNDGPVTHLTRPSSDGNEGVYDSFTIPHQHFLDGTNVLAVEVHNSSPTSSDIVLDLDLAITTIGTPDFNLSTASTVKSRALENTEWSALTEATFFLGEPASAQNIVISELLYQPIGQAENEFIELLNISDSPVSFANVKFTNGISRDFEFDLVLAPGERLVIGKNRPLSYGGMIRNSGESLRLEAADGSPIFDINYRADDSWPRGHLFTGYSIVLANPFSAPDPSKSENWLLSATITGTPGTSDSITPSPGADLQEFFFGGAFPEITLIDGQPLVSIPRIPGTDGAVISLETSSDLTTWQPGGTFAGFDAQNNMIWSLSAPTGKNFARIRITLTP